MGTGVPSSPLTRTYFLVNKKISKENFTCAFRAFPVQKKPYIYEKRFRANSLCNTISLTAILVTRGRIELPFAAWEAAVLAAWPTGHNSKTFGLCSLKVSPVRSFLTSQASFLVHHHGLEPWTHWLRVSCSTNWANGAYFSSRRKVCKRSFTCAHALSSSLFSLSENFLEGLYTLKTEQSYSQCFFLRGYLTFKVKPSAY